MRNTEPSKHFFILSYCHLWLWPKIEYRLYLNNLLFTPCITLNFSLSVAYGQLFFTFSRLIKPNGYIEIERIWLTFEEPFYIEILPSPYLKRQQKQSTSTIDLLFILFLLFVYVVVWWEHITLTKFVTSLLLHKPPSVINVNRKDVVRVDDLMLRQTRRQPTTSKKYINLIYRSGEFEERT